MAHDAARVGDSPWTFEALLRELVDERSHPRLQRLAWSGEEAPPAAREEFLFGLERILAGVEALIGSTAPER